MKNKLLKQALKALEQVTDLIGESRGVLGLHLNGDESPWSELLKDGEYERLTDLYSVIEAIDAELEKPEHEPDAYMTTDRRHLIFADKHVGKSGVALYTSPTKQTPLSDDEIIQIGYKAGFAIDSIENEETGDDNYGFLIDDGTVDNELFFKFVRLVEKAHGLTSSPP